MATKVDYRNNKSLSELELIPGEFMAFNNDDVEYGGHPFLMAVPTALQEGLLEEPDGDSQVLIFSPRNGDQEFWNLYSKDKVIGLWTPKKWNGFNIPKFSEKDRTEKPYVVDVAYSGNEAVKQGLIESGLESYCSLFGL